MEHTAKQTTAYGIGTTVRLAYPAAVERTRAWLVDKGFGILADMGIETTLGKKLDVDLRPYVILGACNPPLAHRALLAERDIGLLLRCNVVVYVSDEPGSRVVTAMIPSRGARSPATRRSGPSPRACACGWSVCCVRMERVRRRAGSATGRPTGFSTARSRRKPAGTGAESCGRARTRQTQRSPVRPAARRIPRESREAPTAHRPREPSLHELAAGRKARAAAQWALSSSGAARRSAVAGPSRLPGLTVCDSTGDRYAGCGARCRSGVDRRVPFHHHSPLHADDRAPRSLTSPDDQGCQSDPRHRHGRLRRRHPPAPDPGVAQHGLGGAPADDHGGDAAEHALGRRVPCGRLGDHAPRHLLARTRRAAWRIAPIGTRLHGAAPVRVGIFKLVEGVIDHDILDIHHARDIPVHLPMYDWLFLAIGGVACLLLGWAMSKERQRAAVP